MTVCWAPPKRRLKLILIYDLIWKCEQILQWDNMHRRGRRRSVVWGRRRWVSPNQTTSKFLAASFQNFAICGSYYLFICVCEEGRGSVIVRFDARLSMSSPFGTVDIEMVFALHLKGRFLRELYKMAWIIF